MPCLLTCIEKPLIFVSLFNKNKNSKTMKNLLETLTTVGITKEEAMAAISAAEAEKFRYLGEPGYIEPEQVVASIGWKLGIRKDFCLAHFGGSRHYYKQELNRYYEKVVNKLTNN